MTKTTSTEHLSDYELAKLITNDVKKIENSLNTLIREIHLQKKLKEEVIVSGDVTINDIIDIYTPLISVENRIVLYKMINEANGTFNYFGFESFHDQLTDNINEEEFFHKSPEIIEFIKIINSTL
jgi:hypothetical protein